MVTFGEDVGIYGGVFKVTRDLQQEFGWDRVRDTPIAEQAIVGLAIGSAMMGLRPVEEIMYVDFLHGLLGVTGRASYAVSKAALIHLTRVQAVELARRGIRVNAVAPGIVETDLAKGVLDNPEIRARLLAAVPLGRPAQPQEVAQRILFLLSPALAYITGQALAVDGGRSAAG